MQNKIDGIVLFSGGLDSLLTARLLAEQGLNVLCLHGVSPFYGSPGSVARWKRLYDINVEVLDASEEMVRLVTDWPPHGFGKVMNPCVDCKITLMSLARRRLEQLGGHFIATGEVIGQRPMSQRRDVMNTIKREAGVEKLLLRPLCAQHLDPTPAELSGLVDRSRLLAIHGRGRLEQLALAEKYGFKELPSPGGGCWLTERENARRYWPLRTRRSNPSVEDYRLAGYGRQYWNRDENPACWLVVGRNSMDNENIKKFVRPGDLLAGLCDFNGPVSLLREGTRWSSSAREKACALASSYAPHAVRSGQPVRMWLKEANGDQSIIRVLPGRADTGFAAMTWDEVKAEKHALAHEAEERKKRNREPVAVSSSGERLSQETDGNR